MIWRVTIWMHNVLNPLHFYSGFPYSILDGVILDIPENGATFLCSI